MAEYAIGDIQGCYDPLMRLLDQIAYNENTDRLWLAGDLVNRGPHSLQVLRFLKSLPLKPVITLGNHDFHLLHQIFVHSNKQSKEDTFQEILGAEDCEELGHWLRRQSILHYDQPLNVVMTHAGIAPIWRLPEAKKSALELEKFIQGDHFLTFLKNMYGNRPALWQADLEGMDRLRVICNYFTRMRLCNAQGALDLTYKGTLERAPKHLYPWFKMPERYEIDAQIVFGHWAALNGRTGQSNVHAIDTGCLWGGRLTALHLQTMTRFSVPGLAEGMQYVP